LPVAGAWRSEDETRQGRGRGERRRGRGQRERLLAETAGRHFVGTEMCNGDGTDLTDVMQLRHLTRP
jgi:hypothetical protein